MRTGTNQLSRALSAIVALLLFFTEACAPARAPIPPGTVPAGRPVTSAEEQYGHEVLTALSEQYNLDYNDPRLDNVIEIVDRLTQAAGADHSPWHVYLFRAPQVKNAAATRGNHVFVWSGLLDVAKSDAELATIVSHEIAHVLAGHTEPDPQEEVKKLLIGLGALAAGVAIAHSTGDPMMGRNLGDLTATLANQVGQGFLVNPYSREKELEADTIGFFMMADAKYNPEEAINFWTRAQSDPDFGSVPTFFSTHPPPENRLEQLRQMLPEALARYQGIASPPSSDKARIADDTFNWNDGGMTTRKEQSPSLAKSNIDQWRVIRPRAILYRNPDRQSKTLGEFAEGSIVTVVERKGEWLEIDSPDHGYLARRDLQPIDERP